MGMMLQLGPKWLHQFGRAFAPNSLRRHVQGQLTWFGMELPDRYPMRINRLDIALDVLNLAVSTFSIPDWLEGWVGYAKPKDFHFDSRSGKMTGFHVGSYKGNTSLKVYDKVLESQQGGDSRFWRSVWDVGEDEDVDVTRFEWTFRCYAGRFARMRYLADFSFEKFLGLLNYAAWIWGSLRIPQPGDTSKHRWPYAPLWLDVLRFIDDYSMHAEDLVRPVYHLSPDIKPDYLNSLAGWLAGLQAREAVEKGKDGPVSLAAALSRMAQEGYTIDDIMERAWKKWQVFSRLARGHDEAAD